MNKKSAGNISLIAAIITILISILALIGWATQNDFLTMIAPGSVKMKVNTALALIFSSVVVLLYLFAKKNRIWRIVSVCLSVVVFLIGILTLAEYIFHYNFGIDELFFRDDLRATATYYAGRSSIVSAANFVIISIGLLFLNKKKFAAFQFFYLSGIALVAFLMLISFDFISDIPLYIKLGLPASIGFITLCAAIYFAQPVIHQQISFYTKLVTSFVAAIVLLAIISVFSSYYNDLKLYTSDRVDRTNYVLDEARQALSLVKDIEDGNRAYVITGDSSYLNYFIAAKKAIPVRIENLKKLTAGNVVQQKNIDSLEYSINERINFSEDAIRLRDDNGLNAAIKRMASPEAKYYTDRIRYLAEEIQKSERSLLAETELNHEKSITAFNKAFYTLLATIGALLVFIFFVIKYNLEKRRKAENEIKKLNTSLEQRVNERTAELQESEKKYRHLFENNPMPMWIIDVNTFQFLNVNDAAIDHYGYSMEDFLSMTAVDIRPETEREKFIQLERSPNWNVRDRGSWKHLKKDGSIIDVEIITHEISYEGKKARFILANDITEKVRAEEKLAHEKQLLRTLIDNLPDYIYFKDTEFRHLVNNKANLQLIGASSEAETIGKSVVDFFGIETSKSFIEDDKLIMKTGATVTNLEEVIQLNTGQAKYLLTTKVPVKDKEGKVIGLVGISRDITKQKEVELELRNSKYFLEKAQKVGHIGHWISHREEGKLTWSEEVCHIFGIEYRDFDGKIETFLNRIHPDDLRKVNSATALAIQNNESFSIDHRIVLSNGVIKWVNEQGEIIPGEGGNGTMLMGIVQDITERKQVEENLINSLKEISDYKYALDASSIVAITNQKGIITYANKNFCKISKYSERELVGQDHRIINSGYHSKQFIKDLWATIANGKIWRGELKNKAKDGTIYWVDTTIVPFLNKEGKPYQYIAIRADITQRKISEELQRELEEKVKDQTAELIGVFEKISEGFMVLDKDFRYKYVNRRLGEMTGHDPQSLIGKSVWEEFPDAVGSATYKAFNEAMTSQEYLHNVDYYAPLDLWQENFIYPGPEGLSVFIKDITVEKRAEEKIKRSEKIYKTIASQIPGSLICLFDRDYRYILMEGDMIEKLGFSKETLLGNKAEEVLPPERYALALPDMVRVFNGETFTTDTISRGYDLVTRYVPLKNENNIVDMAMMVSIDVTELKNAQRRFLDLNIELENRVMERTEQLEEVNKELEAFTYSVSHDLRAPLRIIDGFAGILRADFADKLDEEGNRTLGVIMNNAQRMGQLIDDLLNLSRLGRQEIRLNKVNIDILVKSIIEEELLLNNNQFKIIYQQLLPANCDNGLIRQVWVNLISNAIKYSRNQAHPQITVGCYQKENYITYFVKDNGVGFDMKYAGKLFGVFQRLHKITEFEGTGVGLALVQRIISKHGGKVWAHAEVNKGSTFYFSLPAA
jgi:PAS domain S-box-containing protein